MTKSWRKLCVATGADAVADNQAEEIGAADAEDAANDSTDQALQADLAQPNLEQDNGTANQDANRGGRPMS